MNLWLIEVIHNLDILCNIVFWLLAAVILVIPEAHDNKVILWIWLIALLGVIVIPSEPVLQHLLG
ncbi:MAG: hypothetical protein Q4A62_00380 [Eikenella sp.]|nr:hypothetical protein [Eikenella sp.]